MPKILLLRSPSEPSPDPYESVLRNASHKPYSIPVLETSFTDLSNLRTLIAAGPLPKDYAGIIITSKRSCEAWTTAVKNQLSSVLLDDDTSGSSLKSSLAAWTKVPFYVVGKGTATALEEFQTICADLGVGSRLDIRGENTGTGEQLANFILDDLKSDNTDRKKTLLYLTGDKNRDTVPKILSSDEGRSRGIQLDAVQVYETHGASDFESNLNTLLHQLTTENWWIIFFAPSSAAFTYPILQKHFRFKKSGLPSTENNVDSVPESQKPVANVGAIGRVTSSYLEEELKVHVDAVATKPTPEALLAAIATNISRVSQMPSHV